MSNNNIHIEEVPKQPGERCYYSFSPNPNDTTWGLRCGNCKGSREECTSRNCFRYLAQMADDKIFRDKEFGFVFYGKFTDAMRAADARTMYQRELKALKTLKICLDERGLKRIEELERLLGEENGR